MFIFSRSFRVVGAVGQVDGQDSTLDMTSDATHSLNQVQIHLHRPQNVNVAGLHGSSRIGSVFKPGSPNSGPGQVAKDTYKGIFRVLDNVMHQQTRLASGACQAQHGANCRQTSGAGGLPHEGNEEEQACEKIDDELLALLFTDFLGRLDNLVHTLDGSPYRQRG